MYRDMSVSPQNFTPLLTTIARMLAGRPWPALGHPSVSVAIGAAILDEQHRQFDESDYVAVHTVERDSKETSK
jgi:hypothetical protein